MNKYKDAFFVFLVWVTFVVGLVLVLEFAPKGHGQPTAPQSPRAAPSRPPPLSPIRV